MEENIVSSVKTTEAADGARLEQIAPEKPPVSGGRKAGLIVGIVVGVLALAYIAACAAVQFLYNDTALPHTDVLGVDVSGQAAQQIEALWEQQGERVLHDTAVTLTESGESIGAVTLEELGVTVTPQAAAVAAGASRRYESWGGGALAWLRGGYELIRSWFAQTSAVPALDVDQSALDAACEKLAASLNCTVVDGGYRLEKGEGLYITKPADGRMLDAPQLESDLAAMLQSGELTPVACVYEEKKAQTVDVQAIHDQLAGEKVEAVCDKETGKPTESRVGLSFDVTAVQAQLDAAPAGTEFLADAEVDPGAATRTSSWRRRPSTAGSITPVRSSGITPRWASARRPADIRRPASTRAGAPPPASAAASARCPPRCTTRYCSAIWISCCATATCSIRAICPLAATPR